tara:strand:- start:418 stop:627 length:210 start_codon:yes stop_codon:yes gene_type:complete
MDKSTDYYIKMIANYINDESRDYRYDMLVHLFGRIYKKESNDTEMPSISKEWSRVIKAIEIEAIETEEV